MSNNKFRSFDLRYHVIVFMVLLLVGISFPTKVFSSLNPKTQIAAGTATNPRCLESTTNHKPLSIWSNQTLSVRGDIDLTKVTVSLNPFLVLPGSNFTTRPMNSSFSIDLLDSHGNILARFPFEPKRYLDLSQNRDKLAILSEAVPYLPCTKAIVISKDSTELASRTVDTYSPKVKIIYPLGGETLNGTVTVKWKASDADSSSLTYFVLYSADSGRSWIQVASNIKASEASVNTSELPSTNSGLFRVLATDGVNTGIADSTRTFNVPMTSTTAG